VPADSGLHRAASRLRAPARLGGGTEDCEDGTILRVQVGSGLHGTSVTGQDDRDEMGLCLEPPEFVTGLARVPSGISGDEP
jgi:RNA repair pathway DNA polymerase beta family